MASRQFDEAQRIIHERPSPEWTDNSPLWLIDIDIWLLKKDGAAKAGQVIRTALDRLKRTDDPDLALALLQRRVSAEERMEDRPSARTLGGRITRARAHAAQSRVDLRLRRRRAAPGASRRSVWTIPRWCSLRTELIGLSKQDAIVRALPERPSLIREAAAELGAHAPELLILALERLGLEIVRYAWQASCP